MTDKPRLFQERSMDLFAAKQEVWKCLSGSTAPLDEHSPQDSISRIRMALPVTTCASTRTATRQRIFHLLALPKALPRPLDAFKKRAGMFFGKCFSKKTG